MPRFGSKRGREHRRGRRSRRHLTPAITVALIVPLLSIAATLIPQSEAAPPQPCLVKPGAGIPRPVGACGRLYSETSPFNRLIPPRPQLLLRTSRIVSRTVGFGPPPRFEGGVAGTSYDWGHPIYFSLNSDPVFTVHCVNSATWGPCEIEGSRVHIPDTARAAGSDDGHLAVIDQTSGWEYDFWQVLEKPHGGGRLVVGYGGKTKVRGANAAGLGSDATAAGFGLAAGIIRPEELAAGHIDHALFMVVKCTNGTSVWPAGSSVGRTCSSMGLSDANAPAMGQHFYLDMNDAAIAALQLPSWKKTVLRAMADYGLYVGDTGTMGWGIGVESGASYTSFGHLDPWALLGRQFHVPSWPSADGNRRYYRFDLGGAVDWASELKVVSACVAGLRCG